MKKEQLVTQYLDDLGISKSHNGYRYLSRVILLASMKENEYKPYKMLLLDVASEYHRSWPGISTSISYSLRNAKKPCDMKPKELIYSALDYLHGNEE